MVVALRGCGFVHTVVVVAYPILAIVDAVVIAAVVWVSVQCVAGVVMYSLAPAPKKKPETPQLITAEGGAQVCIFIRHYYLFIYLFIFICLRIHIYLDVVACRQHPPATAPRRQQTPTMKTLQSTKRQQLTRGEL